MRLSTALVIAIVLPLVACGDDPAPEPPPPPSVPEAPAAPDAPADTLDVPVDTMEPAIPPGPSRPGHPDAGEVLPDAGAAEGEGLFTIQVAAFTDPASAELWTDRLSGHGLPVWISIAERSGQTFHRVRIGAAPTVGEARRLGEMLSERYQWPVWVAPVTPVDRPPQGAVETTRRLIGSS